MVNSKKKGSRGELEWVHYLGRWGFEARRGQQYSGSPDSPDVVSDLPIHWEVKRVEKLNINAAMEQAENDCGEDMPVVAHRRNQKPWLVTLRACDFLDIVKIYCERMCRK